MGYFKSIVFYYNQVAWSGPLSLRFHFEQPTRKPKTVAYQKSLGFERRLTAEARCDIIYFD